MARKSNKKNNQRKKLKAFTKMRAASPQPGVSPKISESSAASIIKSIINESTDKLLPETSKTASSEVLASEEYDEITPLLATSSSRNDDFVVSPPIADATTDIPGIIANEIQELEDEYLERRSQLSAKLSRRPSNYSSITQKPTISSEAESSPSQDETTHGLSKMRVRIILWSMYLGIFLASLDISIVSTLLTHIASEYNELERVSFIVTAYLLSNATFQPLYGKISDIFGRKSVFVFCNIMFSVGCYTCGVSKSFWGLVIGRFISGIGGGGLTSMTTITTSDLVSLRDRGYYQGIGNLFYGLGIGVGGYIGGQINDWFGWRWAFLVQVPLSIASCLVIVLYMKLPVTQAVHGSTMKEKLGKIDWSGSFFLILFLSLFSVGTNMYTYAASFVFMIVFIYIEFNIKSKDPILPIHFLKDRSVFGASFSNWFCMMTSVTLLYYLPVYWSTILELSTTDTGKRLAPNLISTGFGSLGAGIYVKRTGKYYNFLMWFMLLGVAGCIKIMFINPRVSVVEQYLMYFVPGVSMSVMITITLLVIIAAVPKDHQASCTSITYAFRSTGSTIGISIGATIFKKCLESMLPDRILPLESEKHSKKELLKIINTAIHNADFIKTAPSFVKPALKECYDHALKNTFLFCLVTYVLATVSVAMVKEFKLHSVEERKNLTEIEDQEAEAEAVTV